MGRFFKWVGLMLAAIVVLIALVLVGAGEIYDLKDRTEGGRYTSLYLPMRDGVRIALSVALPKDLKPGEKVPALIKGTPYWRAAQYSFLGGAMAELGLFNYGEPDNAFMNARGYAIVTVDARGTGASFGHQDIMFDDAEVEDFGEIVDWAAKQSWSNGKVGAYGFSYRGVLAADVASLRHPALKAIAPTFDFADIYLTAYPGGVLSERFIHAWSTQTAALNRGEFPCPFPCSLLFAGPKRVDADPGGRLVAAAIAEHARNYDVYDCASKAPDRDDKVCISGKSLSDVSEFSRKDAIQKSGVPIHAVVGYFDANSAQQALERYRSFSNPQDLTIGAISHGGFVSTDPFAAKNAPADPTYSRQIHGIADFFDAWLKGKGRPAAKTIRYDVLNGGGWHETAAWPPAGSKDVELYLDAGRKLSEIAPAGGSDRYRVDFTASTGIDSRHQSPVDLSQTAYPDRAAQDAKLLAYTGAPLAAGMDIAGNPTAQLTLASSATDGEVIVYLETVSPKGAVTYLAEGVLRLAHRKDAAGAAPSGDPLHTHLAADASPMIPGKAEPVRIALTPIAVRLRKGDRLRVAIAGADADTLERIPARGEATLTLMRGVSSITLPVIGK
ncbi:MAG TPA: CocE/NonD family hydrolase [Rhizomicrobium sp.]|nr:CocE/NonD family hydrolase [Rhizomicrobium sp.]